MREMRRTNQKQAEEIRRLKKQIQILNETRGIRHSISQQTIGNAKGKIGSFGKCVAHNESMIETLLMARLKVAHSQFYLHQYYICPAHLSNTATQQITKLDVNGLSGVLMWQSHIQSCRNPSLVCRLIHRNRHRLKRLPTHFPRYL